MSYRSGLQAFVHRFTDRFPEPEYRYVISLRNSLREAPHIFTSLQNCNRGGDLQSYTIYHRASDTSLCHIDANTLFGISLYVRSNYLPRLLTLHRRPKSLSFANQHGMRTWLKDKPKFAKLGASLASQIHFAFAKVCNGCKTGTRKYDSLCSDCHHLSLQMGEMMSEGCLLT